MKKATIINCSKLNVRKGQSTLTSIVCVISKGDVVDVLESDSKKTWWKIKSIKGTGYVKKSYLEIVNTISWISPNMTMGKINEVLSLGGDIVFRPGTYNITNTMVLTSNSNITCEPGCIFKRMAACYIVTTQVNSSTTLYNGAHDISWAGGTFIGNSCGNKSGNMFNIVHAKNIHLSGMVMKKCVHNHFIEINSSKNVTVTNCEFIDHIDKPADEHKECIQIDFAYHGGLAYAAQNSRTYDYTHCEDIYIVKNTFTRNTTCIGTHTQAYADQHHRNIQIIDNVATGNGVVGSNGIFARIVGMDNVLIKGNKISNFGRAVYVRDYTKSRYHNTGYSANSLTEYGCKDVLIEKNKITLPVAGLNYIAFYILSKCKKKHQNISIINNDITMELDKDKKLYVMGASYISGFKFEGNTVNGKSITRKNSMCLVKSTVN